MMPYVLVGYFHSRLRAPVRNVTSLHQFLSTSGAWAILCDHSLILPAIYFLSSFASFQPYPPVQVSFRTYFPLNVRSNTNTNK